MLLSRFWYVALSFALGASVFILFVAAQVYNRTGQRAMAEALSADSSAVGWYLKDDARNRSSALIPIALSPDIRTGLAKATPEAKPNREVREKTRVALLKLGKDVPEDVRFDALWAVDANGRVIASVGDIIVPPSEDWELGGYGVVADALHGWIRDDAWVWKGRIFRIVARPVEQEVNGEPVGAIIGAKIVDDRFASAVSRRTGAAVGFYAENVRVASAVPEGFDKSRLDVITQDLKELEGNKDYQEKGRSEVRLVGKDLGLVYARMPGEAWELGAGYAVGRTAVGVESPIDFQAKADKSDQQNVPTLILIGAVFAVALLGLAFSVIEHTRPLSTFKAEAARLAAGKIEVLSPSRFRGAYKKIAADINDGIEKAAIKGGGSRRAADLEQVLGPIPAQPAMSAFAVPGPTGPGEPMSESRPSFPKPPPSQRNAPRLRQTPGDGPTSKSMSSQALLGAPPDQRPSEAPELLEDITTVPPQAPQMPPAPPGRPPPPKAKPPAPSPTSGRDAASPTSARGPAPGPASAPFEQQQADSWAQPAAAAPAEAPWDELADWRKVYEEFLGLKRQCGEPTQNLTFEKFQGTLQRNKDALVARHSCARVKFTVYVKEGKAALKASPVK